VTLQRIEEAISRFLNRLSPGAVGEAVNSNSEPARARDVEYSGRRREVSGARLESLSRKETEDRRLEPLRLLEGRKVAAGFEDQELGIGEPGIQFLGLGDR